MPVYKNILCTLYIIYIIKKYIRLVTIFFQELSKIFNNNSIDHDSNNDNEFEGNDDDNDEEEEEEEEEDEEDKDGEDEDDKKE